jgi:hypothetical protein
VNQGLMVIAIITVTEDWSLINDYSNKITEAKKTIALAESQLATKFCAIVQSIALVDAELIRRAYDKKSKEPKNYEAEAAPPLGTQDREFEISSEDVVSNKKLFKKIANLTHPDKTDNTELFIKAKRALRDNDRELLLNILAEAESDYETLLECRRKEYQDIIESVPYNVAIDWFSGDLSSIVKAESYYLSGLLQTLQMKQVLLQTA